MKRFNCGMKLSLWVNSKLKSNLEVIVMGKNNIRYTFEQVKEIVKSKGYELLSDEYVGNKTNLKIKDSDGYLGFTPFASIQNNTTFRKFYTLNPFTLDNIKNWLIVEKKPFELLDSEYIDKSHKMKWKCANCGGIFSRDWNSIINGKGCLHCRFDNNNTEEFVKEKWIDDLIASKGYEWIAGKYKTQSTKLTIKDKIGYKYKVSIVNFKNGFKLYKFNSCNAFSKENIDLWFSLNMSDYKLLTEGDVHNNVYVDLVDTDGYYYNCKFRHLIEGCKPVRFDVDNKHTIKNIQHYLNNNLPEYKVVDLKFNGVDKKTTLVDNECYYYEVIWNNILAGYMPVRFYKSNKYTINNIRNWIKLNNKEYVLLSDKYKSSSDILRFKCINNTCGEIFGISYYGLMALKNGCPYCSNRRVCESNSLLSTHPNLASDWDYSKNEISPSEITYGSRIKVWWKCNKNHSWRTLLITRVSNGSNCPYCEHKLPTEEYNLLTENQELCEEWDYAKNKNRPENYIPNSTKYAHWICKCGHKWHAQIYNRTKNNSGCPTCNSSRGEERIRLFLNKNNIHYILQMKFEDLIGVGGGQLSYDFYLPEYNILSEYQGQFHDREVYKGHDFERQKEHDKRKRDYAHKNKIKLLEIWYWDFDKVEEILIEELGLELNNT